MNTLQLTTSFKREFWEYNRLLLWLPLFIAAWMIASPIIAYLVNDVELGVINGNIGELTKFAQSPELAKGFFILSAAILVPFLILSVIVQLYYFLACLYDERRDLSVYFWRSLPVSDATTIGVKFLMGALVIPAIFMAVATGIVLLLILLALIGSVILSVGFDISVWPAFGNANILSSLGMLWLSLVPFVLWMLPLFAWLMLASMFANKAPFLWATLPIVSILLIEAFIVNYFNLPNYYFAGLIGDYLAFESHSLREYFNESSNISTAPFKVLVDKVSVIGVVLAGVFMYLSYWLRVNRSHS